MVVVCNTKNSYLIIYVGKFRGCRGLSEYEELILELNVGSSISIWQGRDEDWSSN
jgi:hypothetical protein